MSQGNLSFQTAVGSLQTIAHLAYKGYLAGVGISQADYEKLTSDAPWTGSDRQRMTNLIHTLANGSTDSMALPRMTLFAEYLAATICTFVAGINIHAACIWAPCLPTAEDLGSGMDPLQAPRVRPEQLFALVHQMFAHGGHSAARATFEKKLGLINQNLQNGMEEATKTQKRS